MQERSPRTRRTRTFVSLTGPAGNIGDALIRREQLRWALGTSDELVAYTGDAPDSWLRQLDMPTGAVLLRSKRSVRRWLWLLATSPRRPVLIFEAGEVPLHRGNALRELVFLIETLIVRAKGGVVVRPPRGIRGVTNPAAALHTLAARASQFALWRDRASAAAVHGRRIEPDIGFAAGIRDGAPWSDRAELIVSLRGTRPHPGPDWIAAVRDLAAAEGLGIRTVVQVQEDEDRTARLAAELGAEHDPWHDGDPVAHEALLRSRYDAARLVISDRLHVLVLASLSGAVPVEAVPEPSRKISEAFATVGLHDVSIATSERRAREIEQALRTQLERRAEVADRVRAAAERLADVEAEIRATVQAARR